jgi:hypothetical protein
LTFSIFRIWRELKREKAIKRINPTENVSLRINHSRAFWLMRFSISRQQAKEKTLVLQTQKKAKEGKNPYND